MVYCAGLDALDSVILTGAFSPPAQFLPHFHRVFNAPQFVENVIQRAQGVTPWHSGPGKAHHITRHLPLSRLVAVNWAICAGGLVCTVWTLLKPSLGVLHQSHTVRAQAGAFMILMVMAAIDTRHANKRFMFASQSAGKTGHDPIIVAFLIHLFDPNQPR